jgi:hypothetical protein
MASGRAGYMKLALNWLTPVDKGGSRTAPTLAIGLFMIFHTLLYLTDHIGIGPRDDS